MKTAALKKQTKNSIGTESKEKENKKSSGNHSTRG